MCGICGFMISRPTAEALSLPLHESQRRHHILEQMTERITHRGPDDCGYFENEHISMGFRRLSIIDLEAGHQPLFSQDKSKVLTFNGEIYNYKELRAELIEMGYHFSTESDSEVLIHGYEAWGTLLLERLRGMWGFAIYDTRKQELFLARDRFGIKPLHYTQTTEAFIYGSEIKSILEHPSYEKKLNLNALDSYLSFQYVVPPQTLFENIYCLLPGHYALIKAGEAPEIHCYWEPNFDADEDMSEQEAVDKIERCFSESVEAHRVADVEVGCFLSSGIDSSYVASHFEGQRTFTVGFDLGERYNETSWAEELSQLIHTKHESKLISSQEFWEAVPKVQYYLDQPLADPSAVALYFVSQLAAQHVKVVLSGEGADELFGGYTIYHEPLDRASYQSKVPRLIRKGLAACARLLPEGTKGRAFLIRGAQSVEETFIGNAFMFDKDEKRKILASHIPVRAPQELCKPYYDRVASYGDKIISKMQYLDIRLWMVGDILLKADRMSMAHSLELRVPFLDKEVFELARRIPERLRIKDGQTKYALRKAAQGHIPQKWAQKRKLGFPVPTRVWLREEAYYQKVKEAFLSERAKQFFNTEQLISYLDAHKTGKLDTSRKVWTIYSFLVWHEQYFGDTITG